VADSQVVVIGLKLSFGQCLYECRVDRQKRTLLWKSGLEAAGSELKDIPAEVKEKAARMLRGEL